MLPQRKMLDSFGDLIIFPTHKCTWWTRSRLSLSSLHTQNTNCFCIS